MQYVPVAVLAQQSLKNEEHGVFGDPSIFSIVMEFHY
jgi:hypothetical protein